MHQDARPAVRPVPSPATEPRQIGGRRRKAGLLGGAAGVAAVVMLAAACSSGAASTGSRPDTSGSRPAATGSLSRNMEKGTPTASAATGTPSPDTTGTGASTQPDTSPTTSGPTPRTSETEGTTAPASASPTPTGENFCLAPSPQDTNGETWHGKTIITVDAQSGAVVAIERDDRTIQKIGIKVNGRQLNYQGNPLTFGGQDPNGDQIAEVVGFIGVTAQPVTVEVDALSGEGGWEMCVGRAGSSQQGFDNVIGEQGSRIGDATNYYRDTDGAVLKVSPDSVTVFNPGNMDPSITSGTVIKL